MLRRRQALVAGGVAIAAASLAGVRLSRGSAVERALDAETRARLAMAEGRLSDARRLAAEAHGLVPDEVRLGLWVDAEALWLVDGDGGAADGVALVERARLGGARGAVLATAVAAAAVATRNDRHALALAELHERREILGDGVFELVAGAAFDLACDGRADAAYERALERWPDGLSPRVRRARSAVVDGHLDRARELVAPLDHDHPCRRVLDGAIELFASPAPERVRPARVDPTLLPRSLRLLAASLALRAGAEAQGIDAAIDDADGPRALELAARVAHRLGDLDSAERAVRAALRARPELATAQLLAEQLAAGRVPASP